MCKNALKNSFLAPYFYPHCQNVLSIPRVFARIFTLARSRKSSAFLAKITPDPMSHLVKYLIDQFSRECPEDFCIALYDGRREWCRPFNQGDLLKRLIMDSLWIKKEWVNFWYLIKMSFIGDFQFNQETFNLPFFYERSKLIQSKHRLAILASFVSHVQLSKSNKSCRCN